jgi:hypothetical protein
MSESMPGRGGDLAGAPQVRGTPLRCLPRSASLEGDLGYATHTTYLLTYSIPHLRSTFARQLDPPRAKVGRGALP